MSRSLQPPVILALRGSSPDIASQLRFATPITPTTARYPEPGMSCGRPARKVLQRPKTGCSGIRAVSPEEPASGGCLRASDLASSSAPRPSLTTAGLQVRTGNDTCGRSDLSGRPRRPSAGLGGRHAAHASPQRFAGNARGSGILP
ncbi:uncharacterized protein [Kogia breviceps]|uniref:uncharacterized protein n=1 Tax=Kogia breviceps TaxID=27615 RepID=UPI0034D2D983